MRTSSTLALAATMTLVVAGCGGDAGSDSGAEVVTLTIASVTGPETAQGRTLIDWERAVEDASDGRVDIVLQQSGVLGGEFETVEQTRAGAIDGMLAHGIVLFQPEIPELAVEELPFLFPDAETAHAAVDGAFGDLVKEKISTIDLEVLAFWENGYRHFTNSKKPITVPADMSGLKFRSAESAIRMDMFAALGASATPMPFTEVYTGLEQGTIDGQENPLSLIANSGFADVQDHLSISGHLWAAAPLVLSAESWSEIPSDLQTIIKDQAMEHRLIQRERVQEDDQTVVTELEEAGMEVTQVDTEAFREATAEVWTEWESTIGEEFMSLAYEIRDGS